MISKDRQTFRSLGWKIWSWESNRKTRTKNWVDLVLIKPGKCIVFVECKRGKDSYHDKQDETADALYSLGHPVYYILLTDENYLEQIERLLKI